MPGCTSSTSRSRAWRATDSSRCSRRRSSGWAWTPTATSRSSTSCGTAVSRRGRSGTTDPVSGAALGDELHALAAELYPICRSLTGDGVRETLRRIGARIPLEVREVPSGTEAFDWTVPREWNLRAAWIADAAGRRVVDLRDSNLH